MTLASELHPWRGEEAEEQMEMMRNVEGWRAALEEMNQ